MKKKLLPPVSMVVDPNTKKKPTKKAKEVEDNSFREYEFKKPHSENSPLEPWEHRMHQRYWGERVDKEATFLAKHHHTFGHTASQKKGALRVSGKTGAHQLGKRKKK